MVISVEMIETKSVPDASSNHRQQKNMNIFEQSKSSTSKFNEDSAYTGQLLLIFF